MMRTRNIPEHRSDSRLAQFPTFDLNYLYDDQSNPTEITVYQTSHDEALATHWITVDTNTAIPLDEVL